MQGVQVALQRRAGAEGDDGRVVLGAEFYGVDHVVFGFSKQHCIRRFVRRPGQCVAMLEAHRFRGRNAVAETRRQRRHEGGDRLGLEPACALAKTSGFAHSGRFLA